MFKRIANPFLEMADFVASTIGRNVKHQLVHGPAECTPTSKRFFAMWVRLLPTTLKSQRLRCSDDCADSNAPATVKDNLHVAGLVGAAMCSAFECGSHDRWPQLNFRRSLKYLAHILAAVSRI